jgi:hypothetical protein
LETGKNVHRKSSGNPALKEWVLLPSKNCGFKNTGSTMMPGGDSKHKMASTAIRIIDEYHTKMTQ